MKAIFLILPLMFFSSKDDFDFRECGQVDILVVCDVSSSVSGFQPVIAEAVSDFLSHLQLSETSVKVGIISFGEDSRIDVPLTTEMSQLYGGLEALKISETRGVTNLGNALYLARKELSLSGEEGHGRITAKKVIIVLSDGNPSDPFKVGMVGPVLKEQDGVMIFGVLIKAKEFDSSFMKTLSSPYCYAETDFSHLAGVLMNLDVCL